MELQCLDLCWKLSEVESDYWIPSHALAFSTAYTANISAVNFTAVGCVTFATVVWL